jgi:membrane-bound lytic murein transglycosylase D
VERLMQRLAWQCGYWLVFLPLVAACGSAVRPAPAVTPTDAASLAAQVPSEQAPVEDPVATLIARSDFHFTEGRRQLRLGHVDAARLAFNEAVEVILASPYGGRTEPRIREHFDRLIDRISADELRALADGDGFTEKSYEPASIDELLAMSATLTPPTGTGLAAAELDPAVHDIPIPLNTRVLSFVELFQRRLHDFISEGMKRGGQYLPMIQAVFREEGLPLDLAYIPLVESAYKTNALSRARAKGVWQFMSATAREHGLRQDWYIDERSDPYKATVAAAKYLKTLVGMFDGDWNLALASYNGGPGRIQRALRRSGLSDFWSLSARPGLLPRETRDYVPMILAAILIARNPAQYGFAFETMDPPLYEPVTLPGAVDLRRLAEWADTTVDEIQALNPELRRWTTPVRDTEYTVQVPLGTGDLIRLRFEEAPEADLASLRWHTVKPGESLSSIARALRVNRADLAEANDLRPTARLAVGQQLMLPHEPAVLMATTTADQAGAGARPSAASAAPEPVRIVYRVKRGDTLLAIARSFGTSIESIRSWNGIVGSRILANQPLVIYSTAGGN